MPFLITKLIVLFKNPETAIVINDARGYIDSVDIANIANLVLIFGVDLGYVFFLKFINSFFSVGLGQIPLVFVVPNIFAGSFITIFSIIFSLSLKPEKNISYIYFLSVFDPMLASFSTVVLKDVLTSFFISITLITFIYNRHRILQAFIFASSSIFSILLRFRSIPIIIAFTFSRIFFSKKINKTIKYYFSIFVVFPIVISATVLSSTNIFSVLNRGKSVIQTEKAHTEKLIKQGSLDSRNSGRLGLLISKIPSFPLRTTARTVMSILAPIPPVQFYQFSYGYEPNNVQARIFRDLGGIFWHLMLPFLFLGCLSLLKKREYFAPVLFF